jgi:hypothetical protein
VSLDHSETAADLRDPIHKVENVGSVQVVEDAQTKHNVEFAVLVLTGAARVTGRTRSTSSTCPSPWTTWSVGWSIKAKWSCAGNPAGPHYQFIDECCVRDSHTEVGATPLFKRYVDSSRAREEQPMTQTRFGTGLTLLGFERTRSGQKRYFGLRLMTIC